MPITNDDIKTISFAEGDDADSATLVVDEAEDGFYFEITDEGDEGEYLPYAMTFEEALRLADWLRLRAVRNTQKPN